MPRFADTAACSPEENRLWAMLTERSGSTFTTAKGLTFTCTIRGNELFVDRKEKSITRATVNQAYRKAVELQGIVPGPKALGTFGASYLYPIFCELGIIDREKSAAVPKKTPGRKPRKQEEPLAQETLFPL